MHKEDYNRKFCRICTKREYTTDLGVICTLTKQKADFIESCPEFNPDKHELKRIEINTKTNLLLNHMTFNRVSAVVQLTNFDSKPTILKESKNQNSMYLVYFTLATIGIMIHMLLKPDEYHILAMICLPSMFLTAAFFNYKSYRNPKEILKVDNQGISINGKRIFWIELSELVIKLGNSKQSTSHELYMYLSNGDLRREGFVETNETIDEIERILKSHWVLSGYFFNVE